MCHFVFTRFALQHSCRVRICSVIRAIFYCRSLMIPAGLRSHLRRSTGTALLNGPVDYASRGLDRLFGVHLRHRACTRSRVARFDTPRLSRLGTTVILSQLLSHQTHRFSFLNINICIHISLYIYYLMAVQYITHIYHQVNLN